MSYGFEIGRRYNRREDIHARFGGNRQAGIIVAPAFGLIFIMSGARGVEFGYDDEIRPDGTVLYFGEGQRGDMQFTRGNKAIASHAEDGRSILMFEKHYPERELTFAGEMVCEGWSYRDGRDADGNTRKAIVFELRRLDAVVERTETTQLPTDGLARLRELAFAAARPSSAIGKVQRTVYERSADVKAYVLARAAGTCQGCDEPAPFRRRDGSAYLEPHHIRRASDGGPDDPRFVIALCPNCHRRVHHADDGERYNEDLLARMKDIERD